MAMLPQASKVEVANSGRSWSGEESETIVISSSDLKRLDRIRRLARLMDAAVKVPGTKFRLGFDSLVGLVPGVGDLLGAAVSAYIIRESARLGIPRRTLMRMSANVAMDMLIGTVPLLGDVFDVGWKANLRNLKLLEQTIGTTRRR